MGSLDFIMDVEENGFNPDNNEHVSALQDMIDSGLVWQLQGSWGRLARAAIEVGICNAS